MREIRCCGVVCALVMGLSVIGYGQLGGFGGGEGGLLVPEPKPAPPRDRVTIEAGLLLGEVLWQMETQTGFEFRTYGLEAREAGRKRLATAVTDMPIKRALELYCKEAGATFSPGTPASYTVHGFDPGPDDTPRVEVGGYRVGVQSVELSLGTHHFGDDVRRKAFADHAKPHLILKLNIDADSADTGARTVGLGDTLKATTDGGDELLPVGDDALSRANSRMNAYPDATSPTISVEIAFPPKTARRLTVEGELALWQECMPLEFDIPWGMTDVRTVSGETSVAAKAFGELPTGQYSASVEITKPKPGGTTRAAEAFEGMRHETVALAVWPSGQLVRPRLSFDSGTRFQFGLARPADETGAPEKLIIRTYVKSNPTERLPFKIENVPLPDVAEILGDQQVAATDTGGETAPTTVAAGGRDGGGGGGFGGGYGGGGGGFGGGYQYEGPPPGEELGRDADGHMRRAGYQSALTGRGREMPVGAIRFPVMIDGRSLTTRREWGIPVQVADITPKTDEFRGLMDSPADGVSVAADGSCTIPLLSPGRYIVVVSPEHLQRDPSFSTYVKDAFGLDPKECSWVGTVIVAEVRDGEFTIVHPVRLTPEVAAVSPAANATVPRGELLFRWEPLEGASGYRVSLGAWPRQSPPAIFWVSEETGETETRYDPKTGEVKNEADRGYVLEPGVSYYWYVTAVDEAGNIVGAPGGGVFRVK